MLLPLRVREKALAGGRRRPASCGQSAACSGRAAELETLIRYGALPGASRWLSVLTPAKHSIPG